MEFGATSWVAVGLAAVAFFALGGLWYGPLFGRAWMRAAGMAEDQVEGSNLPVVLGAAFVLEVLAALGLAAVIGADATVLDGLATGAAVGVLIAGTTLGVQYLFERRPALLWALNGIHALLGFTLMGAIIGALQ